MKRPEIRFDDMLREVPGDVETALSYIQHLRDNLSSVTDDRSRVSQMGELGAWLRCVGDLPAAEKILDEALNLGRAKKLGIAIEIQQRIRLAHVYQWQSRFKEAAAHFRNILEVCKQNPEAEKLLAFAWQHYGKCLFDQKLYAEALEAFENALKIRRNSVVPQEQIESSELAVKRTRELLKSGK